MKRTILDLLPIWMKRYLLDKFQERRRNLKAPRMLLGYRNSTGEWRTKTRISDTVAFYHPQNIHIANNVFIGHYCILDGTVELEIQEGVQLAGLNGVYTHSSHIAIRLYGDRYQDIPELQKSAYRLGKVSIGKYVFVGVGAKIFSGITIGKGALIAANSVVTRNIEEFQIVSGSPAIVIGDTRKLDEKYLQDAQIREWYDEWQKN